MTYADKLAGKALAQVNRGRRALGSKSLRRLPKGQPKSIKYCPLRRGLGIRAISGGWAYVDTEDEATSLAHAWEVDEIAPDGKGGWAVLLPQPMLNFIEYFDKGKIPLLEELYGPKNIH